MELPREVGVALCGIAGGMVMLIQAARGRRRPYGFYKGLGALFVAGFVAVVVSWLVPNGVISDQYRLGLSCLVGVGADKILAVLEQKLLSKIRRED